MKSAIVQDAAQQVGGYMDRIMKLFKPGAKVTVIVRSPGYPARDFIMSDDELEKVIAACRRRNGRPPDDAICPSCKRKFDNGGTCHMGGCPMGGDF